MTRMQRAIVLVPFLVGSLLILIGVGGFVTMINQPPTTAPAGCAYKEAG